MSSTIVKEAVIVLGVKQGQVDFKIPNLDKLLDQREREIKLLEGTTKRVTDLEKALDTQTKAAETSADKLLDQREREIKLLEGTTKRVTDLEKALDTQTKAAETSADKLLDQREREIKLLEGTTKRVTDLEKAAGAQTKAAETSADKLLDQREREIKLLERITKRVTDLEKALSTLSKAAETSAARMLDANKRIEESEEQLLAKTRAVQRGILDATQMGGEGAIGLARGFVLLGISGEENLRKVLNSLAAVQAGFEIFRGGANIYKSYLSALELASAAEKVSTTVTAANTVGIIANTKAKIANAVATKALLAALGPVGIALAAVAVATAAALAIRAALTSEEEKATDRQEKLADAYARATKAIQERSRATSEMRSLAGMDPNKAEGIGKQLTDIASERAKLRKDQKTTRVTTAQKDQLWANEIDNDDNWVNARLLRDKAVGSYDENLAAAEVEAGKKRIAIQERLKQLQVEEASVEQRKLENSKQINAQKRQEVEKSMQLVKAAQDALKAERDKVQATKASLGQLDDLGVARLKSIAKRKAAGKKLSNDDISFVSSKGGETGQEWANEEFAKRGTGLTGTIDSITDREVNAKSKVLQGKLAKNRETLSEQTGGKDPKEFLEGLDDSKDKALSKFQEFFELTTELVGESNENLRTLSLELEKLKTELQAAAG